MTDSADTRARWNDKLPPDRAWRSPRQRDRVARTAEQDKAAGGPERRNVDLGGGRTARASVELKLLPRTRRIRAYLRWSDSGKSPTRYLGEVTHSTRAENLAQAWRIVFDRGLTRTEPPRASWASTPAVRTAMRANRSKNTRPELALRSAAHRLGLRFRVDAAPIPGLRRRADLLFTRARVAVFLDGCFWHGCPDHYRPARTNEAFWSEKISGNRARDRDTDARLLAAGWHVIRVWEHEQPHDAAERVRDAVGLPVPTVRGRGGAV